MEVPRIIQNYLYSLLKSNPVSERIRPEHKERKKQYSPTYLAYFFEQNVSTFADVVQTLKQETFRRGLSWKPRWVQKCAQCGMKFQEKISVCQCGSQTFLEPDAAQKMNFNREDGKTFLAQANDDITAPSLKETCKEAHGHLNIADMAYILLVKNYLQAPSGDIISSKPIEILSVDPRLIQPILQKNGLPGGMYWICLEHRDHIESHADAVCKICGKKLYEAYFETTDGTKKYYIKDEVKLFNLYYSGGQPPIVKLADEAYSLFYLGKRTRASYEEGHGRGMLVFPTNNPASFYTFWEKSLQMWREDPNEIQVTTFDAGQGKGKPELIKFLDDPNPEQIQVKTDLRNRIMSFFGVSPLFMSDTSASGGLNNEGQQITVTNRAVEFNQGVWNGDPETFYEDGILTWICDQFGITDYTLQLNPSEEQDEMAEKQRLAQDITNARGMFDMGFDVLFEDGKFIFSGQAKKTEAANPFAAPPTPPEAARVSGEPIGKADIKKEADELDEYNSDQLIKANASDAIKAIRAGALYQFYKDIPEEDIPKIHEIIKQAFLEKRLHLQEMTDAITALGIEKEKARMIARTESTGVAMRAREIGWQKLEAARPDEEFLYKAVITNDYRTAPISRRIKAAVDAEGGAVSLARMKEIYMEESTKPYLKGDPENSGMGVDWTGWENFVGHPYERDSIVRVI